MSIQPVPTQPTKVPTQPGKTAAELTAELDAIESAWKLNFAGKRGYNPFVAIKMQIAPLRDRIAQGQLGTDLDAVVTALKTKEPTATSTFKAD